MYRLSWVRSLTPELSILMFEPLEPTEFCERWIPLKTGKKPNEYGYRKECCKLLAELTGYSENTCNNWLSTQEKIPNLVRTYLRVVDILWQIQRLIPLPTNNIKK